MKFLGFSDQMATKNWQSLHVKDEQLGWNGLGLVYKNDFFFKDTLSGFLHTVKFYKTASMGWTISL
jgi:hypothetical protein